MASVANRPAGIHALNLAGNDNAMFVLCKCFAVLLPRNCVQEDDMGIAESL